MCGLSGYIGKKSFSKKIIQDTLAAMRNRGPDHQGYKHLISGENNIYLLSSRLKIVDRNPRSNQPMCHDNFTISYNGEIYNVKDIKKIIFSYGLKLKTNSDTELILKMYQIFGVNCTNYLEGMWAFIIYDNYKDIFFISRDRIGEKPLFFFKEKSGYYFGSETKFIRILLKNYKDLNEKKIFNFLKYGYKSIEKNYETFFKAIYKVEPGTNFIIKKNLSIKKIKYWKPKIGESNLSQSRSEDLIRDNFSKNIKLICNTDLKIGLSLSGGIDSNYLLSFFKKKLNKKIYTYSIVDRSSDKYNEESLINYVTNKYKIFNHKIYLDKQKNLFKEFRELIKYQDKPVSTISYFLQSLIYKKMKKDGIKICISGTGSDELFSGYYHHYKLFYSSLKNKKEKKIFYNQWKKNIFPLLRNNEYKDFFKKNQKTHFVLLNNSYLNLKINKQTPEKFFTKNPLRNKMLNELMFQTVPLSLAEDDLNAMYNSIENRSPFLNKDLVELSLKIPSKYFMKNSYNKFLLRTSSKNILLDKIRLNREKKGFNASFSSIFPSSDKSFFEWFYDNDSKNPIYNYIDKKEFFNSYKRNINTIFSDLSTQSLFNISSTKAFLEEVG